MKVINVATNVINGAEERVRWRRVRGSSHSLATTKFLMGRWEKRHNEVMLVFDTKEENKCRVLKSWI